MNMREHYTVHLIYAIGFMVSVLLRDFNELYEIIRLSNYYHLARCY